jgi:hypothetical protein
LPAKRGVTDAHRRVHTSRGVGSKGSLDETETERYVFGSRAVGVLSEVDRPVPCAPIIFSFSDERKTNGLLDGCLKFRNTLASDDGVMMECCAINAEFALLKTNIDLLLMSFFGLVQFISALITAVAESTSSSL